MLWFPTARTDRLAFELANCLHIQSWMARIEQFGHGVRHEIFAQMALDAETEAEPVGNYDCDTFTEDPPRGAHVRVRADDYGRDPVEGELVELGPEKSVCAAGTRELAKLLSTFHDWDMTSGQFGDSMNINHCQPKR